MRRIILFIGQLDTLNLFSKQLKRGFEELGEYEIFEFDLREPMKSFGAFYTFLQSGPVTAMIGFNSTFYGMKLPSGANMCEQLQVPCVNIFVDHPYWYPDILQSMPFVGVVLCIDRKHMDYVNRFHKQIAVNGFLPHGGTVMQGIPKAIEARGIDVLYAGTLYAGYAKKQKPDFGRWDFPAEEICEAAIRRLKENTELTIESVLEETLQAYGIKMSDQELSQFISSCVYIERVVSSYFREKVLESIARSGISLEIYGDGWEACDWISLPNVQYYGMISPEEVLQKMEDAKVVLNTLPWFKDGSHERVFNGMLRGAVVCSETSGYFEEELPADVWMSYDLSPEGLANLPERLKSMLADTDAMQQMATKGYALASKKHTWQARARELHQDLLGIWE